MAKAFSLAAKATAAAAVCLVAASLMVVARAGEKSRLTGHWNFNPSLSDDAQEKVEEAKRIGQHRTDSAGRSYPSTGPSYPGSAGPPGGAVDQQVPGGGVAGGEDSRHGIQGGETGSPIGGAGGGINYPTGTGGEPSPGSPEANRGGSGARPIWDRVSQNPKFLQIEQHAKDVVITDDAGHSQTYYPDGKKHEEKDSSGKKITTKAAWDGTSLVVETRLSATEKLTESFRLGENGSQLYVKTHFETSALEAPINIRRVYESGKAGTN